jgi:hypothetical protein
MLLDYRKLKMLESEGKDEDDLLSSVNSFLY